MPTRRRDQIPSTPVDPDGLSHVQTPGKGTGAWEESQVPSWPPVSHPSGLGIIPPPPSPHLSCHRAQLWYEMLPINRGKQFTRFQELFTISSSTHKGPMHRILWEKRLDGMTWGELWTCLEGLEKAETPQS